MGKWVQVSLQRFPIFPLDRFAFILVEVFHEGTVDR